ncbi:MAG: hypothetical protein A2202_02560 [Bdellovibrionales bacterium RIFOXYA1_FULL_36_14]|nr:MAG: hypothetical protein A2202_02560 [Bdellovibrionales bacterium RIFOXYA1_FULL_36_14]
MKVEYHKFYSKHLGDDFEIKVFGNTGKPVMVFPTSCGRFFDYENNGMIDRMHSFIENGEIHVICVDSRDHLSWFGAKGSVMGDNHLKYEHCITKDLVAFAKNELNITEKFLATGNSWGGFHALNFSLKFPEIFDSAISLSGAYRAQDACGNYYDQNVYFNDMLAYLPGLHDEKILSQLKKTYLIICHGRGSYEIHNNDAWSLAQILGTKQIAHWYSVWSEAYPHDWPSWHKQISFFLYHLRDGINLPDGNKIIIGKDRVINKL